MSYGKEYNGVGLNELTGFLREAKSAHTAFEKEHGADPHWEPFYASFIRARIYGAAVHEAYHMAVIDKLGGEAIR